MKTICGLDCDNCELKSSCGGCKKTNGNPFGSSCMIAECCNHKKCDKCGAFFESSCEMKTQLIAEFNALDIDDMAEIKDLNALKGSFINLEYTLPNGQTVKFWDDNRIYLGNQICKKGSDRCYGITADENYLLVCEYGENGDNPEIVVFSRRG